MTQILNLQMQIDLIFTYQCIFVLTTEAKPDKLIIKFDDICYLIF